MRRERDDREPEVPGTEPRSPYQRPAIAWTEDTLVKDNPAFAQGSCGKASTGGDCGDIPSS